MESLVEAKPLLTLARSRDPGDRERLQHRRPLADAESQRRQRKKTCNLFLLLPSVNCRRPFLKIDFL